MAWGELVEGNPVFVAANGVADPADINELQLQLYEALGPLVVTIPLESLNQDMSAALPWYLRNALGYNAWQSQAGGSASLWMPLGTLRAGQKITALTVYVRGTVVGGSIVLYSAPISTTPAAPTSIGTFAADPFNTAGTWTARVCTIGAPGTITVAANTHYYVDFSPPASVVYTLSGKYTVQFGN